MKFISQNNKQSCGFTCLKMLLTYLNHDSSYLFLKEKKDSAYSFLEIKQIAKNYSLSLDGYYIKGSILFLRKSPYPFITSVNYFNNKHALLVKKINAYFVYFLDPSYGKGKMKIKEFDKVWRHEILEVSFFKKHKLDEIILKEISDKDKWVLIVFTILVNAFITLAILFLDRNIFILLPIIFFTCSLSFEIFKKIYLKKIMKKMDYEVLFKNLKYNATSYYEYFSSYSEMKKYALLFPSKFVLSLFSSLLIFILFILEDMANMFYLIVPIFLSVFESFFLSPLLKKINYQSEIKEEEIKKAQDEKEFLLAVKSTSEKGYKYGFLVNVNYYVSLLLMILVIMMIMLIKDNISLTNAIFYLASGLFLKENLTSTLKFSDEIFLYRKAKCAFINNLSNPICIDKNHLKVIESKHGN